MHLDADKIREVVGIGAAPIPKDQEEKVHMRFERTRKMKEIMENETKAKGMDDSVVSASSIGNRTLSNLMARPRTVGIEPLHHPYNHYENAGEYQGRLDVPDVKGFLRV